MVKACSLPAPGGVTIRAFYSGSKIFVDSILGCCVAGLTGLIAPGRKELVAELTACIWVSAAGVLHMANRTGFSIWLEVKLKTGCRLEGCL